MKRRTILLIALALIIVLLCVLLYIPRKKNYDEEKERELILNGEKNVAEVFNQGENILCYNGYTFIVDKEKNSIIKYSEKDSVGTQIIHSVQETIGNQIFIMGNRLIFNRGNSTYSSDLNGKNSKKVTEGNIVYMDDNVFVYILQDVSSQYVCITSYNNKNLERTTDMLFNIAKGNEINYLKRQDKILFFYSYNTNGTTTVFSVDLDKSESKVLINSTTQNEDERYEYVDVAKIGNILYSLQATYQFSTDHETYSTNAIYTTYIDTIVTECCMRNTKPAMRIFTDGKKLFTKEYNSDTKQYDWVYGSFDDNGDFVTEKVSILDKNSKEYYWTNILYGDLTELFTLENGELKLNGSPFTTLTIDSKNLALKYAGLFSEKVYVLINQSGKNIWFRFDKDGSNPKKIYEYNK